MNGAMRHAAILPGILFAEVPTTQDNQTPGGFQETNEKRL
jgi:hypothetical protein